MAIVWWIFSSHAWCHAFVKIGGCLGHSGKGEKTFFMNGENNTWKSWRLGLAYINLVFPFCRNHPIDLFCKSVDWSLYNGNTDLNGKLDAWWMQMVKINMLIFRYTFLFSEATPFFISASVGQGKIIISASKVAWSCFGLTIAIEGRFLSILLRHL